MKTIDKNCTFANTQISRYALFSLPISNFAMFGRFLCIEQHWTAFSVVFTSKCFLQICESILFFSEVAKNLCVSFKDVFFCCAKSKRTSPSMSHMLFFSSHKTRWMHSSSLCACCPKCAWDDVKQFVSKKELPFFRYLVFSFHHLHTKCCFLWCKRWKFAIIFIDFNCLDRQIIKSKCN